MRIVSYRRDDGVVRTGVVEGDFVRDADGPVWDPIPRELVGPPDVGKTALVTAFARGLGRPLASLDLGGRGESALIGTRRTRSGAQPGKIAGALRDVGVRDPVFLLEEMDQIGLGKVDADLIEALEEALDWEGRKQFVDRYRQDLSAADVQAP